MDYRKLCKGGNLPDVSTLRVNDNAQGSVIGDLIKNRRRVTDDVKDVNEIKKMNRSDRRKYISRLSDSDRRKVLDKLKRIKDEDDDNSSSEEEVQNLRDLSRAIDSWILYFDEESGEELKKFKEVYPQWADAIQKVLDNEPIEASLIGEIFEPLKEAFKENGVIVPPFVLLSDSAKIKEGFSAIVDTRRVSVTPQFLTNSNNVVVLLSDSTEALVTRKSLYYNAKEISDAELDKFFADDDDKVEEVDESVLTDENGEDNDNTDNDDNGDGTDSDDGNSDKSELSTVISALIAFRESGDIEDLAPLADTRAKSAADNFTKIIDEVDADKFDEFIDEIAEEYKDEVKEDIKETLKEKVDSISDHFAPSSPRNWNIKDGFMGKLTKDMYQSLYIKDHFQTTLKYASKLNQNYLPGKVKDNVIKFGKLTQNLIPLKDCCGSMECDPCNYVTQESFNTAATDLGYLELIDPELYKRSYEDNNYCCASCPNALFESCGCECPEEVTNACNSNSSYVVVINAEPIEAYGKCEPLTNDIPVKLEDSNYHIRVFRL